MTRVLPDSLSLKYLGGSYDLFVLCRTPSDPYYLSIFLLFADKIVINYKLSFSSHKISQDPPCISKFTVLLVGR